jgi:hypothetical protein
VVKLGTVLWDREHLTEMLYRTASEIRAAPAAHINKDSATAASEGTFIPVSRVSGFLF